MIQRRGTLWWLFGFALLLFGLVASGVAYNACRAAKVDDGASASGDAMGGVPAEPVAAKADVPAPGTITVEPTRIDDVLTNPGMGFASFHFGWWCNLPPITYSAKECAARVRKQWPERYPNSGTAYFRWHWRDLEPKPGEIDFAMIDRAIQSANELGMTLSFRDVLIIARALYHDPDVLILDEATSALDNVTEKLVMQALDTLAPNKTVIIIAHRLSTVKNCDVIFFLEDGVVTGQGTFEALRSAHPQFRLLAEGEAAPQLPLGA